MIKDNRVSRRTFLNKSLSALGASALAPMILPSSVLGRGGMIPPSERVTMGFIGIGTQGRGHLLGGAWTYLTGGYTGRDDVQVLAVCDVWRDRRDDACRRVNEHYSNTRGQGEYKPCKAYNDFRRLIERDDIDAVLIATPAHWHATMAVMAMAAGNDVYCEKPTATTIFEAQSVLNTARRHARVFQAGTQQRSEYGGKFRRACEFVRSGRIGRLKEIYAYREGGGILWPSRFGEGMPVPEGFDWDLYLGPAPMFPYDGRTGPHRFDIGNLNWGQHHYDIVQWGAGMDESGPAKLFIEQGRTCYRYPNGVVVYGMPYPGESVGMSGGACFVGTDGRIAVDRESLVSDPPEIINEPLQPDETHLYHSVSHSGNFLECVRTRKKPICDADIAKRAASALLLAGIVKQLQRPLEWDPAHERFVDDAEANRMLHIAKRPPWRI
ncbi:MAG: Gfo/Idh/MocA family oxidoreductase [Verrucomicrobia bacterium]|nr:Gfo/Idh/MocA family oxidoreductase [Verrucomicrobiota bacterium]MCF7707391.1 Gfo/Idh/MocA family oxidoreductase [Verrucomicrobiota bacterium]